MNPKEALQEIRKLLFANSEEQLAMVEGKLKNGAVVKYDLESKEIYVIGQDGESVPAPVGEHELESGEVIIVNEAGKIAEIKEKPEVEVEIEAAKEEEPKQDDKKEADKMNIEEEMSAIKEKYSDLEEKLANLEKKIDEMGKKEEKMSKIVALSAEVLEKIAKEPSAEPIQKPNTFYKQVQDNRQDKYNKLQQVFQNLKNK